MLGKKKVTLSPKLFMKFLRLLLLLLFCLQCLERLSGSKLDNQFVNGSIKAMTSNSLLLIIGMDLILVHYYVWDIKPYSLSSCIIHFILIVVGDGDFLQL